MQTGQELSNVQKELLKLYAKNVADEDLQALRYIMGLYFAEKASHLMDEFTREKGLSPQDLAKWAYEHYRTQNRA
ncbi:MAG: hypothetical protein KDD27_27885 [Saprospiraceae bacterium]|nr:hypothetical protein [Saprospiraceae bacterium]